MTAASGPPKPSYLSSTGRQGSGPAQLEAAGVTGRTARGAAEVGSARHGVLIGRTRHAAGRACLIGCGRSMTSAGHYPLCSRCTGVPLGRLPPENLLKGLQQFPKGKGLASETGNSKDAAKALSQSGDVDPPALSTQSKLVTVGAGLPSLPKKMVDRIISGQYVDFAELPPARGRVRPLPNAEDGHIMVIRAEDLAGSRKLIPDLATWIQCFSVYMAVASEHDPGQTKSLLAYLSTIAKASAKYSWPSWVVYDQNFRQEAADSGLKDWSKVEPSIYTQCFTNAVLSSENWCKVCQSIDHGSDVCPMRSLNSGTTPGPTSRKRPLEPSQSAPRKRPAPHSLSQICKRFNQYNGDCRFGDQCIYQHKCDSCGKLGHARNQCPVQKKETPQT